MHPEEIRVCAGRARPNNVQKKTPEEFSRHRLQSSRELYQEEERSHFYLPRKLTRPEIPRGSIGSIDRPRASERAKTTRCNAGVYRWIVSAKSRGSLETVLVEKEGGTVADRERTWLSERTSEGTIAYSWRGGHDRRCGRASGTVNAQNSDGVNELDHVRSLSAGASFSAIYSLYRGLVFPMGPRLISWLCESDAARARAREPIIPRARISRAIFLTPRREGGGEISDLCISVWLYLANEAWCHSRRACLRTGYSRRAILSD